MAITRREMTDLLINTQHQPARLSPGQLVGARYRLKRIAGAGGMATVWCAHDERLHRPVAIKVISQHLAASPAAATRFAREARMHARIQHPNLVRVYDYSVTATQPYLVMEYIDGSTLSERLDRGGFTAAAIQTLAAELLSAVASVHDHGVLHRDIKSANVLLDRDGRAHLTDLGLARLEDPGRVVDPDEPIVGTLRFLAPELLEGEPASRQSDLFALGVLLRTAASETEPQPQLSRLIGWLTQHDPKARPSEARAALVALLSQPRAQKPRLTSIRTSGNDLPERVLVSGPSQTRGKALGSWVAAISARSRFGSTPIRVSVRAAPDSSCIKTLRRRSSAVSSLESRAAACVSARSRIRRATGETRVAAPARSLFA